MRQTCVQGTGCATHVRRYYASFGCQDKSWDKARRVVAKVEWHPGELFRRIGFIVTNLSRPAERAVMSTAERICTGAAA